MKKMWLMAAVVCAALMVSCGGGDKKSDNKKTEDKKEQQQNPQQEQQQVVPQQGQTLQVEQVETVAPVATSSVEAKAAELTNQMIDAIKAGNEEALLKISAEADAWFETLSEEDKAKADEISNQLARAACLM